MNITIVAGARPNFMKIAPIIRAINLAKSEGKKINYRLVHTGQHYDQKMSGNFFNDLGIPTPDNNLECGGGTQAEQTGSIMKRFELELLAHPPDLVLVVGDVNSTMACAITSKKLNIDTAHIEAGIRSNDMTMPEEVNRVITDSICDHYFTTSRNASENLFKQNIKKERIHFVGNTMIDTLISEIQNIKKPAFWDEFGINSNEYFLLTLHRPSNVEDENKMESIFKTIERSSGSHKTIFPIHPRTARIMKKIKFNQELIKMVEPQGYHEFIYMIKNARGIITDSGGITEEATYLGIPCITLRNNTERPETVDIGTNILAGDDRIKLSGLVNKILKNDWKKGSVPELWDGKTAERIVETLIREYSYLN
jgi:UDP-N-acetylglucosamine 2-epimerase (non-hydrolysing)